MSRGQQVFRVVGGATNHVRWRTTGLDALK